jgi:protein involved in polysaccharide export with SLBB domain
MNHMRKVFVSWRAGMVALFGLMLLSACETMDPGGKTTAYGQGSGTNKVANANTGPLTADFLRAGEQLTIEFLDISPPQQIQLNVPDDGNVTLLLGQKVNVLNKTVSALQTEIHDLYVPKYYHRLTVNIKREVRFVYVLGEVKMAGRFPHIGEMTVLKAIAAAGGFTVYADKRNVEVTRSTGKTEKMNAEKARKDPRKYDLPLYPDDRVNVPLRPW